MGAVQVEDMCVGLISPLCCTPQSYNLRLPALLHSCPSLDLVSSLDECMQAVELFLGNKFTESLDRVRPRYVQPTSTLKGGGGTRTGLTFNLSHGSN